MTTKQLERRLITLTEKKARLTADLANVRQLEKETREALREQKRTAGLSGARAARA